CADGTAMQCGRVGSRLLLNRSLEDSNIFRGFFVFISFELSDKYDSSENMIALINLLKSDN
ncbi:hypothetical protein, partial [Prevotella sp.]|uniref:hypothetical protein n=1 Tax=Prevotella sp. TaxID=59823 RepID=UPI0026486644